MNKILHVSDFHMNLDFEVAKEKLKMLSNFFETNNIRIDIFIFTGDVIDAGIIAYECAKEISETYPQIFAESCDLENFFDMLSQEAIPNDIIEKYNNLLKKKTQEAFSTATNIFKEFISSLGITDSKRIIVCCGNHDRLRLISKKEDKIDCLNMNEDDYTNEFALYNKFCKDCGVGVTYKTQYHTVDGINFLIANTNWKVPNGSCSNEMCINCKAIGKCLDEHKNDYNDNKVNNIFIAHKPFDDICEEAKYDYKKGYSGMPILETLNRKMGTFLFGDKHSYKVDNSGNRNEILSGSPLSGSEITYNLFNFEKDKGIVSMQFVRWRKDIWVINPIIETVQAIYKQSEKHIKKISFDILENGEKIDDSLDEFLSTFNETNNRLIWASQMFASCCKCLEYTIQYKSKAKRVSVNEDNIFKSVSNLILNSDEQHPLNIRGEGSVGKSAFIGIEYLYILHQYYQGEIAYIPFYFNMEYIISSEVYGNKLGDLNDCEKIFEESCKQFDVYLDKCLEISNKNKQPICLFVDGLDQVSFLSRQEETIEKHICYKLKEKLKKSDKYILALNTYKFLNLKPDAKKNINANLVIYFNAVTTVATGKKSYRFMKMIESYSKLKGIYKENEWTKIGNNFLMYRKASISLNFLHSNFEFLKTINEKDSSWEVMNSNKEILSKEVEKLFSETNIKNQAELAAFLIQQKGITFFELQSVFKDNKLTYNQFCLIKNKPETRKYLIASHFVTQLRYYVSHNDEIDEDSVLYYFITRDIAVMIRLLLYESEDIIVQFVKKHRDKVKGYLHSTLIYIAGHSKDGEEKERLSNILDNLKQSNSGEYKTEKAFQNCNRRSKSLAEIICTKRTDTSVEFIYQLMDDIEYRKFNRNYQLYYYEDKCNSFKIGKRPIENSDTIEKGFDFHNCFYVLTAKLRYNFNQGKHYMLMEVDLFTLCDLIYSRLQNVEIHNTEYELSFFYNRAYNKKDNSKTLYVIDTIIELLKEYLMHWKKYNLVLQETSRLYTYYNFMLKTFNKVKDQIKENADKDITQSYVNPAVYLEQISKIKQIQHIGWNINDIISLNDGQRNELNLDKDNIKETIQEAIMDAVIIALLYLPEKWKIKRGTYTGKYSKEKIIMLILIRELGKHKTGDFPPFSSNILSLKTQEQEAKMETLILGSLDGFSNMTELYDLFETEIRSNEKSADVNLVISREIALIQREYKYYELMSEDKIKFTDKRKKEFEKEFENIATDPCKEIKKMLIHNNPKFKKFF